MSLLNRIFTPDEAPDVYFYRMRDEQLFEETVDNEQVFVMKCNRSERTFVDDVRRPMRYDQGAMHMSVAFELEHEETFHSGPALRLVLGGLRLHLSWSRLLLANLRRSLDTVAVASSSSGIRQPCARPGLAIPHRLCCSVGGWPWASSSRSSLLPWPCP